jgi:hypothetical protein
LGETLWDRYFTCPCRRISTEIWGKYLLFMVVTFNISRFMELRMSLFMTSQKYLTNYAWHVCRNASTSWSTVVIQTVQPKRQLNRPTKCLAKSSNLKFNPNPFSRCRTVSRLQMKRWVDAGSDCDRPSAGLRTHLSSISTESFDSSILARISMRFPLRRSEISLCCYPQTIFLG